VTQPPIRSQGLIDLLFGLYTPLSELDSAIYYFVHTTTFKKRSECLIPLFDLILR
jgi:hypothetical protein